MTPLKFVNARQWCNASANLLESVAHIIYFSDTLFRNAMTRPTLLFLLAAGLLLAVGCSDTTQPAGMERWVYYSTDSGVYRHELVSSRVERVTDFAASSFSRVADNGIVLVQRRSDGALFGRCENGTVIPVPFPVHPDSRREYTLMQAPGVSWAAPFALAPDGHHGAYGVIDRRTGGTGPDSAFRSVIVLVDCSSGTMRLADVSHFAGRDDHIGYAVHSIVLDRGGGTFWLNMHGGSLDAAGAFHAWGNYIVQWKSGQISTLDSAEGSFGAIIHDIDAARRELLVSMYVGPATGRVYELYALPVDAPARRYLPPRGKAYYMPARQPVMQATGSVFVTRTESAVELRSAIDGSLIATVGSFSALVGSALEQYLPQGAIPCAATVSADGEWIVCVLQLASSWPDASTRNRIIAVKRDGSSVRAIAAVPAFVAPVVSGEMRVQR